MDRRSTSTAQHTTVHPSDVKAVVEENTRLHEQCQKTHQENVSLRRQLAVQDVRINAARKQRETETRQKLQAASNLVNGGVSEIQQLKEKNATLQLTNKTLEQKIKDAQKTIAQLGLQNANITRQLHAANSELGKRDGHTHAKRGYDDEEEDDDEYCGSIVSDGSFMETETLMDDDDDERSQWDWPQSRACAVDKDAGTAQTSKKRAHQTEDEADRLSKRLRTASLEPNASTLSKPPRQARIVGEKARVEMQQQTKKWQYQIVHGYGPNGTPSLLTDNERTKLPAWLTQKLEQAANQYEDSRYGQLWYLDPVYTPSQRGLCIGSKMVSKSGLWRHSPGSYACERCVESKSPCFTYDSGSKSFRLLPLHPCDRTSNIPGRCDGRRWIEE